MIISFSPRQRMSGCMGVLGVTPTHPYTSDSIPQHSTRRLKRSLNIRVGMRGGDAALLGRQWEVVDSLFNQRAAVAEVSGHVVVFCDVVPVAGRVVHKVNTKSGALSRHRGRNPV